MLKNRQKFSLRKFIKRAAFITLVLALIEVAVIVLITPGKKENKLSAAQKENTSKDINGSPANTIGQLTNEDPITTRNTNEPAPPVIAAITKKDGGTADTTSPKAAYYVAKDSNKKAPTIIKNLSRIQMYELLLSIQRIGSRNHAKMNCVQVRKTANSNVANGFKVAEYLKSKGCIITGRTTIGGYQQGIKLKSSGECVVLTIGTM